MDALTLIVIETLSILALLLALSVIVGRLGIWSVGHLAFFAVGQLVAGTAVVRWGMGVVPALLTVVSVAGVLSLGVGVITLRLQRDYFVVLSLALAWTMDAMTLAVYGSRGVSLAAVTPELSETVRGVLFLGLPAITAGVVHVLLGRSKWSAVFAATRQDPLLAATLGIPTLAIRVGVFAAASTFAAIVGASHAFVIGNTDPVLGGVMRGILLFCLLILGGVNATSGVIFSTLAFVALPRILEYVLSSAAASFYAANLTQVSFALATYAALRVRVRAASPRFLSVRKSA